MRTFLKIGQSQGHPPKKTAERLTLLPSQSLTWNLKMAPWNRRFLLETILFRFHVKLGECKPLGGSGTPNIVWGKKASSKEETQSFFGTFVAVFLPFSTKLFLFDDTHRIYVSCIYLPTPEDPCMLYLATFTIKMNQR